MLFGEGFGLLLCEAALGQAVDEPMSVEGDGLGGLDHPRNVVPFAFCVHVSLRFGHPLFPDRHGASCVKKVASENARA